LAEDYKFRITCKLIEREKLEVSEFEFRYQQLGHARANYKAILLGLYRKKDVLSFSICLNRCRDKKWSHAIFKESLNVGN
jgi:hypothetical protein